MSKIDGMTEAEYLAKLDAERRGRTVVKGNTIIKPDGTIESVTDVADSNGAILEKKSREQAEREARQLETELNNTEAAPQVTPSPRPPWHHDCKLDDYDLHPEHKPENRDKMPNPIQKRV